MEEKKDGERERDNCGGKERWRMRKTDRLKRDTDREQHSLRRKDIEKKGIHKV